MNEKFEVILKTIENKLEYHERHDDSRFGDISNGLWEIRLQNAIRTGKLPVKVKEETLDIN